MDITQISGLNLSVDHENLALLYLATIQALTVRIYVCYFICLYFFFLCRKLNIQYFLTVWYEVYFGNVRSCRPQNRDFISLRWSKPKSTIYPNTGGCIRFTCTVSYRKGISTDRSCDSWILCSWEFQYSI